MKFRNLNHVQMVAELFLEKEFNVGGIKGDVASFGYRFLFDNAKKRFGQCHYSYKTIKLSAPLCEANLENGEQIIDTILHELAHAISYELYGNRGHNAGFRSVCKQIGCSGSTYYSSKKVKAVETKYTLTCPCCKIESGYMRRSKHSKSCGKCSGGTYNEKFKMIITQNY